MRSHKKSAEIDLQRVHNRKSHALRTAFAVKPLWTCDPSGFGIRGPGSGSLGSRHTPRGSKPHQPRDKEKSPEEGLLFGRSGTVRGMTVPARRVERKDTGLLEQSISCYLFCVKNNLAKGLFTMRFCRDTESADPERCGTALCKKGCEQLCSRAVERLTRLLDDLLGKARHPHAGMIG